ncbi:MAG TPA: DUF4412 domain-containing protein [Verrucomicrobiae bacterium]
MKRTLAFLILVSTVAAARADFVIQQKMESAMQNGAMTMKIKGDKIRVDMAIGKMGDMSTIMDLGTGEATTLMHQQKMAMKISAAQMQQMMAQMKSRMNNGGTNAAPPKLQDTGKTETINGYSAEIYNWTNSGSNVGGTIWVAKSYPNYKAIMAQMDKLNKSPMSQMSKGIAPDTSALPGMVIKTKADVQGQEVTTTLISAQEEPVNASAFDIPKDYQEMNAPTMPAAPVPATPDNQ